MRGQHPCFPLIGGALEGKWQEGMLERARGQVQRLNMPVRECRFHPEVVGSWDKILNRGEAGSGRDISLQLWRKNSRRIAILEEVVLQVALPGERSEA